jgi:hypothetical protein
VVHETGVGQDGTQFIGLGGIAPVERGKCGEGGERHGGDEKERINDAPDGSAGNGGKSAILSSASSRKFLVQTRNRAYFADYSAIFGCYNQDDPF